MSDTLFHCGICHRDTPDLTKHRRDMHSAGGFSMKNGCELTRCPKWLREHPESDASR
jgi:hypothetical protein